MTTVDMTQVRDTLRRPLERALHPLARLLLRLHVAPNHVSVAGVVLNVATAALVIVDRPMTAAIVYLAAGAFDLLDGLLARLANRATAFGAFLDSTMDRISEGVVFAAVAYQFAAQGEKLGATLVVLALLGALLVSYTRARAEAVGCECNVGILTRAERVILLTVGLFFGILLEVMYVMVALSAVTVAHRVLHTRRQLRAEG